ncbi:MAG TPA: glycosyltransferase family 2 protein [Solirubrobacteraceae bacterium]|nr:glycosyltransferase family 2 protein [Solirubrobacteraceae bacterium]
MSDQRPVFDAAPRELSLLSVVAPVFNEELLIDEFYARVCGALEGLPFELVLVDDGSSDGTALKLDAIAAGDDRVRVVYLSRNFGHQTALTAGLDHARGDAVVMLDADLQDPPELIPTMLDHWRAGCDVVYAVREHREGESRFKLATARWFYALFDRLAQVELQHNSGDFRLLDRRALDALLSMRERNRFLRGMTVWVGYTQAAVPYRRDPRYAGETKYTLPKMLKFSLDAISSFSHRPLQLATLLGFLISSLAFIAIPVVVILRLMGSYLPGFGSVTILVLLLGGIELIAIGIIGEYVGRIYDEVKGRPLYLVRARRNMSDAHVAGPSQLPPLRAAGDRAPLHGAADAAALDATGRTAALGATADTAALDATADTAALDATADTAALDATADTAALDATAGTAALDATAGTAALGAPAGAEPLRPGR